MDGQAKDRRRRARTSKLPAAVRWQSWMLTVLHGLMLFSLVGGAFLPVVILPVLGIDVEDYFDNVFGWQLAGTVVLVLGGLLSGGIDRKIQEAMFADAHVAVGRVVDVITESPYDGEAMGEYELVLSAELPGAVTIRRKLRWSAYGSAPRLGETIRFRHNTVDPDDLGDVLYESIGPRYTAETPVPDDTGFWVSQAKTWRTRARIRWWSGVEVVTAWAMPVGIVGSAAMVPVTVVLIAWLGSPWLPVILIGLWGVVIGLIPFGFWANGFAGRRFDAARIADGLWCVGRIDDVVRLPDGGGDDGPTHDISVIARIPGRVTLHRRILWRDRDAPVPSKEWVGRAICFRHHNHTPDDLRDAFFDGWPDDPR